jgi:membrane protein
MQSIKVAGAQPKQTDRASLNKFSPMKPWMRQLDTQLRARLSLRICLWLWASHRKTPARFKRGRGGEAGQAHELGSFYFIAPAKASYPILRGIRPLLRFDCYHFRETEGDGVPHFLYTSHTLCAILPCDGCRTRNSMTAIAIQTGQVIQRTVREFIASGCTRKSAALAYYATFSLAPLLVLVIAILGTIFDPQDVRGQLEGEIERVLGRDGAEQIRIMMQAAEQPQQGMIASLISLGLVVFGASSLVEQLQVALNETWQVQVNANEVSLIGYFTQRLVLLSMVLIIGLLLLASVLLSSMINLLTESFQHLLPTELSSMTLTIADHAISTGMTATLFAMMFRLLPAVKLGWKDVWLGAFITAVLFDLGKHAMGVYLGSRNMGSAYGAAGSLALVLIWIYYSSIIFLLGAGFTRVWSEHRGNWIAPRKGAVRVIKPSELQRFSKNRLCPIASKFVEEEDDDYDEVGSAASESGGAIQGDSGHGGHSGGHDD